MTRLWTGSAVRTGHSQQGLLSPHFVRCAATDPSNTTTQHGFNQAIRKRVQLKQSHRKISNHPPHAVLDLGADTKTLKSYMDSLVEVQTSLDLVDCRNVLEATLARDAEPVRKPHTVLCSQWPCRRWLSYCRIGRLVSNWQFAPGGGLMFVCT